MGKGWSLHSASQFVSAWAPSTVETYNRSLEKLFHYCNQKGFAFPNVGEHCLAEYLCDLAMTSKRPKSMLNTTVAALTCFSDACCIKNPVTPRINRLIVALIKTGTSAPMKKTEAMPVQPIMDLFLSWPGNYRLTLEQLRRKAVTLLALSLMLRPSDIAPKGKVYNKQTKRLETRIMTTDQIRFFTDGSMKVTLHGIKNDYHRDGFEVRINKASEPSLDPVKTLQVYIERTAQFRNGRTRPLFIALKKPFSAVGAETIGNILEKSLKESGLLSQGFTAKSFRPTGATLAIEGEVVPDTVRKVGRWKSRETFEEHYVHSKPPQNFTDIVLGIAE